MTRAEEYRQLANKVRARAFEEESPILRAEWETLADSYVWLAEQTDEIEQLDVDDPILGLLGALGIKGEANRREYDMFKSLDIHEHMEVVGSDGKHVGRRPQGAR